jgi:drug/metabolite transporter (DMT)-like permease
MVGFAANSLLCRAALAPRLAGPVAFTAVRLASGAVVLTALAWVARRRAPGGGSWASALALFAYAVAFSLAYVRIPAGVGALLLFVAVQATMLAGGFRHGERPTRRQWAGAAVALAGLAVMTAPGARAPDPIGAVLMLAAGIAWGVYSLRGRAAVDPIPATADNFLRTVPLCAAAVVAAGVEAPGAEGVALAIGSGAVASGLGYALWYAALPALGVPRAAVVQLTVPVLAAFGGAALLGERPGARTVAAGAAILAGVGIATLPRRYRRSSR